MEPPCDHSSLSPIRLDPPAQFHTVAWALHYGIITMCGWSGGLGPQWYFSHTMNLEVTELGRQRRVIIVCLSPRCTHKLTPLDVWFMGPSKYYYSMQTENWMKIHPYRSVTEYK
jgi:hypothetical protein